MSDGPRSVSRSPAVRRVASLAGVAAVAGLAASAAAHVAPSEDTNNRYVKLTPMADRVRVAYTILVGQEPGRVARRGLDRDGDRVVSEAESDAWGADLAAAVLAEIQVTLDGVALPVTWSEVHVGMDDRSVDGGAFSLDLIAWICAPGPGPRHELDLDDRFSLVPAGETEVRVADEPGIRVDVAKVGVGELVGRKATFQKLAAPLAEGVHLVWTAVGARPLADGRCAARAGTSARAARWPWIVGGTAIVVVVVVVVVGIVGLRRRR